MRGTKRKIDTCTINSEVVTNVEFPSETHEATGIVYGHTGLTGEGSNQTRPGQVTPVNTHILEGPTRWLGLEYGPTAQLDGTGLRPNQVQTAHLIPASRQVVGQANKSEGVGPDQLGVGYVQPGNPDTVSLSLASEASNWREPADL